MTEAWTVIPSSEDLHAKRFEKSALRANLKVMKQIESLLNDIQKVFEHKKDIDLEILESVNRIMEICTDLESAVFSLGKFVIDFKNDLKKETNQESLFLFEGILDSREKRNQDAIASLLSLQEASIIEKILILNSTQSKKIEVMEELLCENKKLKQELAETKAEFDLSQRELRKLQSHNMRTLNENLRKHTPVPFFPATAFGLGFGPKKKNLD